MARLFFALWPDQGARRALATLARETASTSGGRAVPAPNLHLTLVFLGEVPASRFASVREAATRVEGRGFGLTLDRIGSFTRTGVAWAGCGRMPVALAQLQSDLAAALAEQGFAPEARAFAPHLTLVRRIARPPQAGPITPITWQAQAFALAESKGGRAGYETVQEWPLAQSGEDAETPAG